MHPFAPLSRFARFSCISLLVLGIAACGGRANLADDPPARDVRARFGGFTVTAVDSADSANFVTPALAYNNKPLAHSADLVRTVDASPIHAAFPLPECQSRTVQLFTGGANCCFGYYIMTECPDAAYAAYMEPRDGGLGDSVPALKAYAADEGAFMYYEPKNQKGKKLSFSRVESPRPKRHIVFDNGTWRADKPGEFKAAYSALLADSAEKKLPNRAAQAIIIAYYSLMAGESENSAAATLKYNLPKEYAYLAPTVFADVKKAVAAFNPVKNLVVGAK